MLQFIIRLFLGANVSSFMQLYQILSVMIMNKLTKQNYYKLFDRYLIARTTTDMLFKYFLDYLLEEVNLIDPSLLTVFRRERLSNKDKEDETVTNLMDRLIAKTVEIALQEGVIEFKNKIIQDSTHKNAMYQHISPREELIKQSKELRKAVYKIDETMQNKMPKKRESTGANDEEICQKLLFRNNAFYDYMVQNRFNFSNSGPNDIDFYKRIAKKYTKVIKKSKK